jgi:hypothetical protein
VSAECVVPTVAIERFFCLSVCFCISVDVHTRPTNERVAAEQCVEAILHFSIYIKGPSRIT